MVELIAKRYGIALYELATENNQVEQIEKEIKTVQTVLKSEIDFMKVLNHPQISLVEKQKLVEDIFKESLSKELLGFIHLTIKKGRQEQLYAMLEYFQNTVNDRKGVLVAHVTSVEALTEEQMIKLQDRLEKLTKKKIEIQQIIDPNILGGLKVRIKDRIVDYSIQGRIKALSNQLLVNENQS